MAALALVAVPLPTDPASLKLSPDYYANAEIGVWLQSARDWPAFYVRDALWRYDAVGYVMIARDGYAAVGPGVSAFPPLYPLAIRAVETLLAGQWVVSALLVSAVGSLASAYLLARLAGREIGRATALAPALLLLFPTAFFLAAPYAEALFLALSLGCLLAGRTNRWLLAGGLGCLGALTRIQGITLAIPLLILAWPLMDGTRGWARLRLAMGVLGPVVGSLGAEAYSRLVVGDPGPIAQQATSNGWTLVVPGWPLVVAAYELASTPVEQLVAAQWYGLPLMLVSLGFWSWGWRRLPAYLNWYGLAVTLPGLSVLRFPALAGAPRYLLLCIPLFLSLALWANTPLRRVPLVVISGVWQAVLVALFAEWAWLG